MPSLGAYSTGRCRLGLGYLEGYTHDYKRHGTTTLFAALEVATGKVIAQCKKGHRHQQFIDFLRHVDANTPADLNLHVIVDNYATHRHPKVKLWLADHPRFQFHFTPTYSSWLNQVEIFFGIITRQAIRHGSCTSVKDLISKIDTFIKNYNTTARPLHLDCFFRIHLSEAQKPSFSYFRDTTLADHRISIVSRRRSVASHSIRVVSHRRSVASHPDSVAGQGIPVAGPW